MYTVVYNKIKTKIKNTNGGKKYDNYYLYRWKKISKKKAAELIGKELLKKRIEDAKKTFMEDPYILNEWMDGMIIKFGGK